MQRRTFLAATAVAACTAGAWVLSQDAAMPDVRFITLTGEDLTLASLRGQVVLVNFWASTCGACKKEMPRIVEAHRRFAARGYRTIAVAVSKDDRTRAEAYARRQALPFTVAFDDGSAGRTFGNVRATPTIFLIDRKGRVVKKIVGRPRWDELNALVEDALAA
jgi:peroxiredoxin